VIGATVLRAEMAEPAEGDEAMDRRAVAEGEY
jgi:hypothetical protein